MTEMKIFVVLQGSFKEALLCLMSTQSVLGHS